MKRFFVPQCLLILLLLASAARAQTSGYNEKLKSLAPFIGKWKTTLTLPEDIEGVGKQGEQRTVIITYTWTGNGQGIVSTIDWDLDGKVKSQNTGLIAWDPGEKEVIGLTVHPDGGMTRYKYRTEGETLLIPGLRVNPDGTKTEIEFEFFDIGQDHFLFRIRKRIENGKDTTPPPGPALKATRVKG